MIKKILLITTLSIASTLSLVACRSEESTTKQEDYLNEVSIVDGEIVSSQANTSNNDTISIPIGKTVSLTDILSAMYGDNIELHNIVCTKGAGEIEGDNITVKSNAIIEFDLTIDGSASHQKLKIIGAKEE